MELETARAATIEQGRGLDMTSGGENFHLLISRIESRHTWTLEVGISGIEKGRLWTTGVEAVLLWIIEAGRQHT